MTIDKNKPLPDHTKLDYDECCAFLTLKEVFPEKYNGLILSDRPDLQTNTIGVEVTVAIEQNHQEALNNWVKANYCEDENRKKHYIERMKQLGVSYSGGVQHWPGYHPSLQNVLQAVENKTLIVKRGKYRELTQYELFVITDTWFYEETVAEALQWFSDQQISKAFSTIYVLSHGYVLYIVDLKKEQWKTIRIDINEQSKRNIRAREMVEEAESKTVSSC